MSDFPPIASLRSFEAVARLGSVTLAAKELHVTHSAISQQIKVLEEMVGVKLFIRNGRGVQLNEEGRLYALQVREALNHIADATRLVQVKPRKQELTLAMVPSFGCHWLLPRLERFRAKYPLITLRIQASLTVTSLQQEGIDITRGELVQLTSITAPYPWPYWLVTAQPKEAKPEVALFVAWLNEEVRIWLQQTAP